MIVTKPGHIDHIKQNNVGVVYELIDRHGPISRIELSKLSQLAPASITKITRELLQAHIITEVEFNQNLSLSRGRPAIGLQISRLAWQFISIRLYQDHVFIALHQIDGLGLIEERYPLECRAQNDLLNELFELIRLFSDKYNDTIEKVCAIAVTVSGLVNQMSGNVIQMPTLKLMIYH